MLCGEYKVELTRIMQLSALCVCVCGCELCVCCLAKLAAWTQYDNMLISTCHYTYHYGCQYTPTQYISIILWAVRCTQSQWVTCRMIPTRVHPQRRRGRSTQWKCSPSRLCLRTCYRGVRDLCGVVRGNRIGVKVEICRVQRVRDRVKCEEIERKRSDWRHVRSEKWCSTKEEKEEHQVTEG